MTKKELITEVAMAAGTTNREAEKVLNATIAQITGKLAAGETVRISGFGSFRVRKRAERETRNPRTGGKITVSACKTPVFKPGKTLKDTINR